MKCPSCGHENIPGVVECEECQTPLVDEEPGRAAAPEFEPILEEPLGAVDAREPLSVGPSCTVEEVVRTLADGNIGCVLVTENDDLIGIFSERDVLMSVAHRYEELRREPIRNLMTPAPETLAQNDTIAFALNRMDVGDFRHIPVVERGKVASVVSVRAVTHHIVAKGI